MSKFFCLFLSSIILTQRTYRHIRANDTKVARIVVDEAHQLLTQRNFRDQWANIHRLGAIGCQKILITASLPIRQEKRFLEYAAFPVRTYIIRAPSAQPHIAFYQVPFHTPAIKPLSLIISIAKYLQEHVLGSDGLGIIFCLSKDQVDELHSAFTHCSSHSEYPDRHSDELAWTHREKKWIGATTGLIQGIDSPHVCATIFWDVPHGLVNVYQGSGRGGRAGQVSHSVTVNQINQNYIVPARGEDVSCKKEAEDWLAAKECRRLGFSRMLDNTEVTCADLAECAVCDFCNPNSAHATAFRQFVTTPIPSGLASTSTILDNDDYMDVVDAYDYQSVCLDIPTSSAFVSTTIPGPHLTSTTTSANSSFQHAPAAMSSGSQKQEVVHSMDVMQDAALYQREKIARAQKIDVMNKIITMLANKCAVCWAWKGISTPPHEKTFLHCKPASIGRIDWVAGWVEVKRSAEFVPYTYCYFCQLPQVENLDYARHGKPGTKECTMKDLVAHLTWFIYQAKDKAIWNDACTYFHDLHKDMTVAGLKRWYPETNGVHGFFNGLELVVWYFRRYHKM
jgi:hypothetical protein